MTDAANGAGHDSGRYCGGRLKQREGTCTRPAGWGTPHPGIGRCKLHLGSTESHVVAARKEAAGRVLAAIWNPNAAPITDSVSEMQRLAGGLREAVDVLGSQLDIGGTCEACGRGSVDLDSAHAIAWVRVLRELRQLLGEMERLGIAERLVALEAARVRLVAVAFGRALDAVGLGEEERVVATRVLLTELRAGQDEDGPVLGELEGAGS